MTEPEAIKYIQIHTPPNSKLYKIIEQIKEDTGIKSDAGAVRYAILQYQYK